MSMHRRRTHRRPAAGRRAGVVLAGLALLVLTVSGAMAPANAAKGGNGGGKPGGGGGKPGGGSLSVVVLDGPDDLPNHAERITFDVSTTATDRPFVGLMCWQGDTGVYNKSIGVFADFLYDPWLTLDSSYWTPGGEANCSARLYHYDRRGNQIELATMNFVVLP